ncbi:MAG: hypothetical protein ACR2F6_00440 [Mycobacteriales bacterium]
MDLAAAELTAYGVEPGTFHAQQLSVESVAAADLVLTTELGHRADVVPLVPGALRTAFTLREFARLLPAARQREPPGDPRGLSPPDTGYDVRAADDPRIVPMRR